MVELGEVISLFFFRRSLRFWLLDGILLFPTLGCGAIAVVLGLFNRTVNSTVCCCSCLGILKRTVLFGGMLSLDSCASSAYMISSKSRFAICI